MTAFADVSSDPVFVRPRFGPVMHVKSSRHPILGSFHLVDLIITELKDHMTYYNFEYSHWWKIYL